MKEQSKNSNARQTYLSSIFQHLGKISAQVSLTLFSIILAILGYLFYPKWQSIPQEIQFLLTLILTALSLILSVHSFYLRNKIRTNLKPLLGVYWDKQLNAYCPACKSLLSNYAVYKNQTGTNYGFYCANCKQDFFLSDSSNLFISYAEAVEIIKTKKYL